MGFVPLGRLGALRLGVCGFWSLHPNSGSHRREMLGCGSFVGLRSVILRNPTPQGNLREIKHSWKNLG